jgi:hypothetical protein
MRADIHDGQEHHALQSKAGYIYGRPRLCKGFFGFPACRVPAVIYPVSIDPDGFRGMTPNH